jgi:chromosome segregation ATPase
MSFFHRCFVAGLLVLMVACTPTATRPEEVSTLTLLLDYNRLEDYLKDRRRYLRVMKETIALLDDDLLDRQVELSKIEKRLNMAEVPSKQLEQLLQDSEQLKAEAQSLSFQILESQEAIEKYDNDIVTTNTQMKSEAANLRREMKKVSSMRKKLDRVKLGIKRMAAITLKYSGLSPLMMKVAGLWRQSQWHAGAVEQVRSV